MHDMGTHRNASAHLFSVARDQQGFFTTKQAEAAGFRRQSHYYHVQTGHWIREHRGIYRLAEFPTSERPDLVRFWLWSRNRDDIPQGVYSHETALSLHELSDVMPAKLHMTVPKTFRRMAPTPRAVVLHHGALDPTDIETLEGVPVTTPLRTILDVLRDHRVSEDVLVQALRQALQRGTITRKVIRETSLPEGLRAEFSELMARAA
jgi:predicted transcriptional regulator of viral defense system